MYYLHHQDDKNWQARNNVSKLAAEAGCEEILCIYGQRTLSSWVLSWWYQLQTSSGTLQRASVASY
jgi:hypothetical protein